MTLKQLQELSKHPYMTYEEFEKYVRYKYCDRELQYTQLWWIKDKWRTVYDVR
jgi:hypothetical protein